MRFFSIRLKLSLALVGLSFGLVLIYIGIARSTFESDKISYVFETEQTQLENVEKNWSSRIEDGVFLGKSILSTFDSTTGELNRYGKTLFQDQKSVTALELWDVGAERLIASVKRPGSTFPKFDSSEKDLPAGELSVRALGQSQLLVVFIQNGRSGEKLKFRLLLQVENIFPKVRTTDFFLSSGGEIVNSSGQNQAAYKDLVARLSRDRNEKTETVSFHGEIFLVSSLPAHYGDFRFIALTTKSSALGALATLYNRSLIFILFSGFFTVLLALFLSGRLTEALEQLTQAARRMGEGHFDPIVSITSKDEVGILSGAFSQMSVEIQRLLIATRDKVRMENEIKTASLIQETLLPKDPTLVTNAGFECAGHLVTTSECSGDWWYYFEDGNRLIVAIGDATGHGTPPALITAGARAVFSTFERQSLSPSEMMTAWNEAIRACSGGKVFMTAQLVSIDQVSGQVEMINAGHEWPYFFQKTDQGFKRDESLEFDKNLTLGESQLRNWNHTQFELKSGDFLLLYSDGVFAIENAKKHTLNEKGFARAILKRLTTDAGTTTVDTGRLHLLAQTAAGRLVLNVMDALESHGPLTHPPDDVTIVTIHRR